MDEDNQRFLANISATEAKKIEEDVKAIETILEQIRSAPKEEKE